MELARIHDQNELFEQMKLTSDLWEQEDNFRDYLPSWEQRDQLADVFRDFDNRRMASPCEPGYSATVYAGELQRWIERNEIESAFLFVDGQKITVVSVGERRDGKPDNPLGAHRLQLRQYAPVVCVPPVPTARGAAVPAVGAICLPALPAGGLQLAIGRRTGRDVAKAGNDRGAAREDWRRPKAMRSRTYEWLLGQLWGLEERRNRGFALAVSRLMKIAR